MATMMMRPLDAQLLAVAFRREITHAIIVPLASPSVIPTGLTNIAVSVIYLISTAMIYYLPS